MKVLACCVIAYLICNAECGRKVLQPLDKHANLDFINMEGGGVAKSPAKPVVPGNRPSLTNSGTTNKSPTPVIAAPVKPGSPVPSHTIVQPVQPAKTPVTPVTAPKPVQPQPAVKPVLPAVTPQQPGQAVPGAPTPGPGSVQHLINFYDSQGKASPIRPYSYTQAVKQG